MYKGNSKEVTEKDAIIEALKERVNLLMGKTVISMNVFSNDMAINMHYDYSPSP